jgi:hypothetical protein
MSFGRLTSWEVGHRADVFRLAAGLLCTDVVTLILSWQNTRALTE